MYPVHEKHVQLMVNSPKCEHLKEKNSVIIQVM